MNLRKSTFIKKLSLTLVVFVLLFSLGATFLEAWSCKDAFFQCWLENMGQSDFAIIYCGIGYVFCEKYIK